MLIQSLASDKPLKVALLGASGAVGQELLRLLDERSFPIDELRLLAYQRSAGTFQDWKGKKFKFPLNEINLDLIRGERGIIVN